MTKMNHSLWQDEAGVPGVIRESPIPSQIADEQIVVQVHAWAMNPADAIVQDTALPFIKYPLILGEDIAGIVESVGSVVATKFQPGDRILGLALGAGVAKPELGAFQDYVILDYSMACKIPESMSFTNASVFPLCIATAAYGLFSKNHLGLPFPTTSTTPNSTGKSILIWGGSSGVGSNAIQLCKAAGFEVLTTCSAHNSEYVKDLGADKVFHYTDADVIDQIVTELDKGKCVGIFQAAGEPGPSCQVAHKSKQILRVAASNPVPEDAVPEGVEAKMIFASEGVVIYHETSLATFTGYLPEALAQGTYQVAPSPEIVSTIGLEGIQEALDLLKKGVSAKKLVVAAK
ncbi:Polyketide synthase, enoylreductase [Penicillium expansum]|uniref:Polyketide synthase, enoylreductase n=1 Tax=Penicillium expansum TaxID=27334 RepID=A0A0A2K710_PENEN|nr:Polyketide synthase, enoylreductase [Penicillium expansum]KGO41613.1 Polyketide synthase, enoylreductase [Penicillium expansum]KGO60150.1 Polyketide synthase, enoylreductase [Penicillium expansum]KGO65957.1 Polyketide synthase, enoylreductase [Penicillium expansum]